MELTFLEVTRQTIIAKPRKNLFDMGNVLLKSFRENEDIIEENNTKQIEEIVEAIVGVGLERRGGIREAKGHDKIFVVTIASSESSFPFVTLSNPDSIISFLHVEPGEELGTFDSVE
jgi:hypothetical protein